MGAEGVDKKLATEHVGAAMYPKQRERERERSFSIYQSNEL